MRYPLTHTRTPQGDSLWRAAWLPYAEAGGPGLILHDLLEHRATDTGTWEEELMAFGRILYLRYHWYASAPQMSSDLVGLLKQYHEIPYTLPPCREPPLRSKRMGAQDAEEHIQWMLPFLMLACLDSGDTLLEGDRDTLEQSLAGWLRRGFRDATQQWQCRRDPDHIRTNLIRLLELEAPTEPGETHWELRVCYLQGTAALQRVPTGGGDATDNSAE